MISRKLGFKMSNNEIKKLKPADIESLFDCSNKEAKTKPVVAIKALSNKLSRTTYYIMRDQVAFDEDKLFS